VQLIEDASLSPGGCRVFSESGAVDADLETQLDRICVELLPAPGAAA
jgi:flagellar biosynthesis/type III secretory pathway protein FliH